MVDPALGLRVVRGPDWEWGDQDGGEGFVGTVAGLGEDGGEVIVQWDMGQRCKYRCGKDNKFDLRVLGSGPSGHSFSTLLCHVCRKRKVYGVVWKCLHCSEYYMCSNCYRAGQHCLVHRFAYLLTGDRKHSRVPPRAESRNIPARGLFVGAVVERGVDWRWKDQDGGKENTGKIVEVTGWNKQDFSSEESVVVVVWQNGNRKKYRAGHKGKVDVLCTSPSNGLPYYPEHLPILGCQVEAHSSHDIVTGDRVRCDVDMGLLTSLQDNPAMAEKIGLILDHVGAVNSILENGDLLVRYPSNTLLPINPQAAKKVDIPAFECGDVVRMISDMAEAYKLQQGHGEWNDDMALCLDQVGTIVKSVGDGNVVVSIAGYRWVLNPCSLRHAPDDELSPNSNPGRQLLNVTGLGLLVDSLGPGILVHATSSGDLATVQAFLDKNPQQVNTMEQGKTAVHVAVEECRLKILEVLLKFNADVSRMDGDGDTPLHTCSFHNAVEAATLLLEAGADVNARNGKRCITPIMIAGAVGHFRLLEIMASHHTADVNVQDMQSQTALHHALLSQRTRAVPILLKAGADLTLLNSNFFSPLLEAAGFGFLPGVEDIVRCRPDLKDIVRPSDNLTALHLASVRDRYDVVRHLALSGCDMNLRNEVQRTALHITAIEGHSAIIECLVGHGVDINARDSEGNTVLHVVLVNKNARPLSQYTPQMNKINDELKRLPLGNVPVFLTTACFLIQEGADLDIRNNRGQTAGGACPPEKRDALLNYVNKSNRGEFHGSLRNDKAAVSTENISNSERNRLKSNVRNSMPSLFSSSSTDSSTAMPRKGGSVSSVKQLQDQLHMMEQMVQQHQTSSVTGMPHKGGSVSSLQEQLHAMEQKVQQELQDKLHVMDRHRHTLSSGQEDIGGGGKGGIGHHGNIMQAQIHEVGRGGGSKGHRERDRQKLLEERKKEPVADSESHSLTADEREQVRKRREVYFQSRDQSSRNTAAAVTVDDKTSEKSPALSMRSTDEQKGNISDKKHRVGGAGHPEKKQVSQIAKGKEIQNSRAVVKEKREVKQTVQTGGVGLAKSKAGEQRSMEKSDTPQKKTEEKAHGSKGPLVQSLAEKGGLVGRKTTTAASSHHQLDVKDGANAAEPCFVCEMPANARFNPCGHVVACKRCASRAKRCPICKVLVCGVS